METAIARKKKMKAKNLIHEIVHSDNVAFTFMRSAMASLASAIADLGSRILFYSLILTSMQEFYRSNLAVASGAVIGGVVNCCVNYKFTFHASGQDIKAVAIKFMIVWGGNLLLNMYGTTYLARPLSRWQLLLDLGFTDNGIFAVATFIVAGIVSIFWNFLMQRHFVYQRNIFDTVLDRWLKQGNVTK